MHAGHFISRRHNATLFDEMNVHAQCAGCNTFRNGQPHIYAAKLIQKYGEKEFQNLVRRSLIVKKFTRQELLSLIEIYKKQL